MKNYLVVYEKAWHKNESLSPRIKNFIKKKVLKLTFLKTSFKAAPYVETQEGTKISESWLLSQFDTSGYQGLIVILEGERLNGRNGVHIKKTKGLERFSIIQIEAKKRIYRNWALNELGDWFLESLHKKTKGAYKQIQYTFEHEIGHSLCYLHFVYDTLHIYVKNKNYETWWNLMDFK